jgi:hypothetical protein
MNIRKVVFLWTTCGLAFAAFLIHCLGQPGTVSAQAAFRSNKEIELGGMYTGVLAHRVSIDVRVLMLLESNNVAAARSLLFVDLEGRVAELSELKNELGLTEVDSNILSVGQQFISRSKAH